ncbi:virulence promoting factor [Serratia ureilytica]|nr:virulence promoting factor [Serratia ureilytica]HBC0611158.1 virulence promoting factor [Serratia marcescens]
MSYNYMSDKPIADRERQFSSLPPARLVGLFSRVVAAIVADGFVSTECEANHV